MRYLGVDPGGKRMGVAVADTDTGVATPLEVVPYRGLVRAAEAIEEQCRRHDAAAIVVGLPVNSKGEVTPACARSRALASELEARGLTVILHGEYLTTNEARRRAREIGLRADKPVDHIAAAVVLEDWLEVAG
jgi:putative Holliday junction resolvase